jgi:adenosine kinase
MRKYAVECRELGIPYVYDPSQQLVRMGAEEIRSGILSAEALFVNEYEFALIEKIAGLSRDDVLQAVKFMVITCGKDGAQISILNEQIHVPVVPPDQILDPTGVGDAFRGGFLTGYGLGLDLETCGQMGALAATYCLENSGPQGHSYTPQEFVNRFRQHFDDGGKLDIITLPQKE